MPSENTRLIVCQLRSAHIHTTRQHHRPTSICRRVSHTSCGQLYGGICVQKIRANTHQASTRHLTKVVSMLVQRLRRWPNIKTASGDCLVLLGRVVLAQCPLPPVCAAKRESPNSHDSRPTLLQITPLVGLKPTDLTSGF